MMSGVKMIKVEGKKDWRVRRKTLAGRQEFLVNNDFASDIKFSLRNGDQIFAHKFPLTVNSPVFAAMFHGPLATKEDVIQIVDCDNKRSFVEFLRYLYCEECEINEENVFDILYMAKKYLVHSVVEKCVKYLSQDVNVKRVLVILQHANKFGEEKLSRQCIKYICQHIKEVFKSEHFVELDPETLKIILNHDKLSIKEIELFKYVQLWCDNRLAHTERASEDFNEKRQLLGDVLHLIRFPTMSAVDFAENCVQSGLLTPEECCSILCYLIRKKGIKEHDESLASELISPHGFSMKERLGNGNPRCFSRPLSGYGNNWSYGNDTLDALDFCTNEEIDLAGVTLFGNYRENTIERLFIVITKSGLRFDLRLSEPILEAKPLDRSKSTVSEKDGFVVFFERSFPIREHTPYTLCVEMSGPQSKSGLYVKMADDALFTFYDRDARGLYKSNGTTMSKGQFPELWYDKTW